LDRSAVERVVRAHLPRLSGQLGLHQWEISAGYSAEPPDDDGSLKRGDCTRLIDYQSAHISLNPEAFADEAAILVTLRHELFHIVLAPFDLYTSAVERIELPEVAEELLERVRDHAIERVVAGLERMWVGLSAERIELTELES
jgi:hypothetical protein